MLCGEFDKMDLYIFKYVSSSLLVSLSLAIFSARVDACLYVHQSRMFLAAAILILLTMTLQQPGPTVTVLLENSAYIL